jgi:HK97 family phage major capsid protein
MNLKEQLKAKMAAQTALMNKAMNESRALNAEEIVTFNALETEITQLEASIEAEEKMNKRAKTNATAVNTPLFAEPAKKDDGLKLFKNLGEQLNAIKNAAVNGVVDERLLKINKQGAQNAALGGNEGEPEEGGYLVQTDFAAAMLESAAKSGQILPLVDQYEVSGGSNRVEWVEVDETSVATTVFGGVQVYWAAEAAAVTASQPKLIEKEIKLQKLMGLAYSTMELDADSNFSSQLYEKAFTLGIQRELENCIISAAGTGVGKPLSFLKGGSLVTVAKETAQANGTIVWENIVKMYNRALDKSKGIWLCHPDASEQLDFLSFPIGTGGVPVYLPAAIAGSISTLKGRPVIESDHCSALGSLGDFNFVDLSQYMLIKKGGIQSDVSMHVQFLTGQNAFRFIFRANGMPKKNSALTIKNSANTRSSFVTLAAR